MRNKIISAGLLVLMAVLSSTAMAQPVPDILYYKLNEGSGTTSANDANPGQGNSPVTVSGTWITSGQKFGAAAINFGGAGDGITTGVSGSTHLSGDYTFEMWFRSSDTSNSKYLFWDGFASFTFLANPTTLNHIGSGLSGTVNICDGNWHHVALVNDATANTFTLYVNGVVDGTPTTAFQPTGNIFFGQGASGAFDVDEIRLRAVALSQAAIQAGSVGELPITTGAGVALGNPSTAPNLAAGNTHTDVTIAAGVMSAGGTTAQAFNAITLTKLGTIADTDVTNIKLWRDNNSDGMLDGGDTQLGATGTFSGGTVTFTGAPLQSITAPGVVNIVVTISIPASVTTPETFGVSVNASTDVTAVPGPITGTYPSNGSISSLGVPEIGLSRGVGIADGGTDAVATVGVENQAMTALTYSIDNSGSAPLNLTGTGSLVVQSNASGCTAVIVDPTTNPIAAAGSDTFTVTITPTAAGAWSVDISIANDDANENPYNFTISGTATAAPEPEIDITDPSSNPVASGGVVAITGSAAGTPIATAIFTITNSGNADLTITAATTGADSNGVSNMSAAPAATVTASSTTTFDVDFTPANAGAWSTLITITNNDTNEGTYTITLSGTAQAAPAPEIAVEDPANVDITDGSTESVTNTGTAQFSRVYTILNSGAQALNLIGTAGSEVVISSQNNCTVTVTQPANSTLPAAGGSPTTEAFTLVITPGSAGLFSFNVSIANDDANENPFDWTFNGNTTTPSTGGSGGGGGGSGCASGTTGSNVWFALLGLLGLVAVIRVCRVALDVSP